MNWGHWVNLTDYTPFGLITFGIGCAGWLVVYVIVIRDMLKKHTLEIPIGAICSNFAWEIYWGLGMFNSSGEGPFRKTDMGLLFQWAYFLWFFFDVFVVVLALKYGRSQMTTPASKKYYYFQVLGLFAVWMSMFYFFIPEFDDSFGALTGFGINTYMSILYIFQKFKQPETFGMSKLVAWCKFISTGLCTFVCFERFIKDGQVVAGHHTTLYFCIAFAVVDLAFIYIVCSGELKLLSKEFKIQTTDV